MATPEKQLLSWMERYENYQEVNNDLVKRAGEFVIAHQGPLSRGLSIAQVLLPLNCDRYTLAAAILLPTINATPSLAKSISEAFDASLSSLVAGALQMNTIQLTASAKSKKTAQQNQIDNLRKMLLAMVDDIRVVLIKLAECLVILIINTQFQKQSALQSPAQASAFAQLVVDYYIPLANRLGIGHLKWQLEDNAFRYLDKSAYLKISKALKSRRVEREKNIQTMIEQITALLHQHHVTKIKISGRAKHIYSIHQKMLRKQVPFEQLYDTQAIRILVPTVSDCYAVLGIIHNEWVHIDSEFDDYIAKPKSNGYQSIHTAIIVNDKPIEIQIRTFEMHEKAEMGFAAHWKYKENSAIKAAYENKIAWLRAVLNWQKQFVEVDQADNVYQQAFSDRIYVFSPLGDVYDLPANATPLDFAYLVHTNVGHRCRGAKINDKLCTLSTPLKTGDRVEIITGKENNPSRDWLRKELGFLTTAHAFRKVRHWFLQQEAQAEAGEETKDFAKTDTKPPKTIFYKNNKVDFDQSQKASFDLDGSGSMLLTQLARCCNPIPGDDILGYITQGRGISVHQSSCSNIQKALQQRQEKVIEIHWKTKNDFMFRLKLMIVGTNYPSLINHITTTLANLHLSMLTLESWTDVDNLVHVTVTLALKDNALIKTVTQKLKEIKEVISLERR